MDSLILNIIIINLDCSDQSTTLPHITQINKSAVALLGYTETELVNKPLATILPTTDVDRLKAVLAERDSSGNISVELTTKLHESIAVTITYFKLSQGQPDVNSVVLVVQNVSDQVTVTTAPGACEQIEYALTESEERFRQMAEMTGEWLWEQDPSGYYIYCSNAVNQIIGFSPEEVIGKHYTQFLTARDKASQLNYASNHRAFYGLINHYRHKDGHLVYTESTGLPIASQGGHLLKWRGVDRDITAKKHFQDALIENEKRTRLIIESSLSAIVIIDAYGIITDWNLQSEKMFGWTAEEAIGQRLEELIIPEPFRQKFRQGLKIFLHIGICPFLNQLIEQVAIRRDGSEFPVELSVSPLKLGNTYIFSGFIHDITARKAAEQQIREAQVNLAITQSEIKIAQQIQTSLLPSKPIKTGQFEITGLCLPADQVGGDYFDYFFRSDDCLDMIIADVSGHAIGSALFMVEARSAIRTQAKNQVTPSTMLDMLNNFLFEDLNQSDYFITLFYLQYDCTKKTLRFANAGHPPALLLSCFQPTPMQLDADGLILGIRKHVVFEEQEIALHKGDLLLIYTDGLTEAENAKGEFFGVERVSEILTKNAQLSPQQILTQIRQELTHFCQRETFKDDISLMLFKRH